MNRYNPYWNNPETIHTVRFVCGYCGADTAPSHGYTSSVEGNRQGFVAICTNCNRPSFLVRDGITVISLSPAPMMGESIDGLPSDIGTLYDEARQCTSAGAYTAAVLTCRKILMHVAVEKQAPPNKNFFEYVTYLFEKNYIPQDGREWVDHIRTKSNEANHEIVVMTKEDAEDLISFTEMLLRMVYEFKNRLARKSPPAAVKTPGTPR